MRSQGADRRRPVVHKITRGGGRRGPASFNDPARSSGNREHHHAPLRGRDPGPVGSDGWTCARCSPGQWLHFAAGCDALERVDVPWPNGTARPCVATEGDCPPENGVKPDLWRARTNPAERARAAIAAPP